MCHQKLEHHTHKCSLKLEGKAGKCGGTGDLHTATRSHCDVEARALTEGVRNGSISRNKITEKQARTNPAVTPCFPGTNTTPPVIATRLIASTTSIHQTSDIGLMLRGAGGGGRVKLKVEGKDLTWFVVFKEKFEGIQ